MASIDTFPERTFAELRVITAPFSTDRLAGPLVVLNSVFVVFIVIPEYARVEVEPL